MASEQLVKTIEGYENYIDRNGIDIKVLEAYSMASQTAYSPEAGDIDYAKGVSARAKALLDKFIHEQTNGGDFLALESWCRNKGSWHPVLDYYYDVLYAEAPYYFDSYLLYLEKERREQDRFYSPKRTQLNKHGLIQAMQDLEDDKLDILSISMPPGTQKCQPLYSKILTPDGFITMGEVRVGTKVIAGNGNIATVISISETKKRPIYEVTFDDGSKTRCSDNHIWHVQTRDDRSRGNKYRDVELKDMIHNYIVENGKRKNYSVDYVGVIQFSEKDFVIHPYVMGVILGDGGISQHGIIISSQDQEIIDKIDELLPDGYSMKHKYGCDYRLSGHEGNNAKCGSVVRKELEKYGLMGLTSIDKHIPTEYKYGSYIQRLWLLRGLMDTDGSAYEGYCVFNSISEQLSKDVAELVHSLGGYASITKGKAGYRKNGEYIRCNDVFTVTIEFDSFQEPIFNLHRKYKKYKPKRKIIKRFISNIEYIGEEDCRCILIDDPCHLYITDDYIITHNTTLEKFFCSWIIGRHPDDYSLFFSHSGDITRMFYDGILDITTNATEYQWNKIFGVPLQATNAKAEQINFGKYKPFASIQCTSVGSKNAGKVRCNRYLYCDDLIGGIAEALNKNILDKLWGVYSIDARQRKLNEQVKEIHIATRWSVHDVIGRLQNAYEGSDRAKFIAVPDIDPTTGESNFQYKFNGMSTEFFKDQEKLMDDISYRCLYKNEPIEREGLLYHEDDLRRYMSLPLEEPDAIVGVCDTKTTGTDYMVLTVFYQYGDDYYLVDCVCDSSSDFGVQQNKLANIILKYNMQQCEFESNAGGSRLAKEVSDLVNAEGGRCNITTKPTETNKETRIIVNSNWIKTHCLFKDRDLYQRKSDYGEFMYWLLVYSVTGKNPHDDVPDCLANFALFRTRDLNRIGKVEAIRNPFMGMW